MTRLENSKKRIHPRGQLIEFKIREESGKGESFTGYAKNISRGGLFIASLNPREPGERFHITFQIPGTDINIRCQCEVMWTYEHDPVMNQEPGYGVSFIDLPKDIAVRIDHWVLLQGL